MKGNKIIIQGIPASPGIYRGRLCIIEKKPNEINIINETVISKGDILVSDYITPFDIGLLLKSGAVVTNEGGITSHAAINARELGIPCIVSTENATTILKKYKMVTIDGNKGSIFE